MADCNCCGCSKCRDRGLGLIGFAGTLLGLDEKHLLELARQAFNLLQEQTGEQHLVPSCTADGVEIVGPEGKQ